jgi:hypothetical protein
VSALGKKNGFDIAKNDINLLDFISSNVTDQVRHSGFHHFISCPKIGASDTDPSLAIYQDSNSFCCWHCGGTWNGTIIDFVMGWKDLQSPIEALKFLDEVYPNLKLLDEAAKEVFAAKEDYFTYSKGQAERFHADLLNSQSVIDALASGRNISIDAIKTFMLGLSDWGEYKRLAIPQMDRSGRVLGFVTRQLSEKDERPRYLAKNIAIDDKGKMVQNGDIRPSNIIIWEKGKNLYNLPRASMHAKQVVNRIVQRSSIMLVEGHLDVVAAFDLGLNNVVAYGTKRVDEDQVMLLSPYDEVVLIPDTDAFDVVLDNAKSIRDKFPSKVIAIMDLSTMENVVGGKCKDIGDVCKYSRELQPELIRSELQRRTVLLERYIVERYLDKDAINRRTQAGDIEGSRYIATIVPKFLAICTEPIGRALILSAAADAIGVMSNVLDIACKTNETREVCNVGNNAGSAQ